MKHRPTRVTLKNGDTFRCSQVNAQYEQPFDEPVVGIEMQRSFPLARLVCYFDADEIESTEDAGDEAE